MPVKTENYLQYQKWSLYKVSEAFSKPTPPKKEDKWPNQYQPSPFYSQP